MSSARQGMMPLVWALKANYLRNWALLRRYIVNHVGYLTSEVIFTYGVLFAALYGETPSGDRVFILMAGLLVWHIGARFVSQFSSDLRSEMSQGTLEQNCVTGVPLATILITRAWTAMALNAIWGLLVIIPAYALLLWTKGMPTAISLQGRDSTAILLTLVLILLGLQGIGLTLAAVVLRAKSVGLVSTVLGWALLFFTGVLSSPDSYPAPFWYLGQLLPVTHGLGALRYITLEGMSFASCTLRVAWFRLAICSGCHLLLGIALFSESDRQVRTKGILSHF